MIIEERKVSSPIGEITLIRLTNDSGGSVELSSLGAGIVAVEVPDTNGKIENVALAYANPADYLADGPCMGKVPGRYANRIAGGKLIIEGKEYQLDVNNGPNHLHGGPAGFQNHIWDVEIIDNGVRFSYFSPDGEENYPGNLTAVAEYRWNNQNELTLNLFVHTDAPTVINLTNHAYWNLNGADSGTALNHLLQIKAHNYVATDDTLIPIEAKVVASTPMDFRLPKTIGKDIHNDFPALNYGKGYDAGWLLDCWQKGKMVEDAIILSCPQSGRVLSIDSDQPVAHVYSGNWLDGSPINRSGKSYNDYDGIAIELQGVPDAPNQPQWPSQLLLPGEEYSRTIRFKFSCSE